MTVYHTKIIIGDELGPVMAGHVVADTPAEAREWFSHEFFYQDLSGLPQQMEYHIRKARHSARVFGYAVKATKSAVDPKNAINA